MILVQQITIVRSKTVCQVGCRQRWKAELRDLEVLGDLVGFGKADVEADFIIYNVKHGPH